MSGSASFGMNYTAADEAARMIEKKGNEIAAEVKSLADRLVFAGEKWTGQGQNVFYDLSKKMEALLNEFSGKVHNGAQVVRDSAETYSTADGDVARSFNKLNFG